MALVFNRPESLTGVPFHYCPGCTHGIIHRLIAEAIDILHARENTAGVASVGCSVFAFNYFNIDILQAAHGRAPAVATGVKRVIPNRLVFTYQGDGDLASIGFNEVVHAAARGENITVIFINNAIFGMTGGQMAPTTIPGQRSTTTPGGRDPSEHGHPLKVSEMLALIDGAAYISRVSVHSPKHIKQAKDNILKAFQFQERGEGFSLVEVLSTCPTNWGLSAVESLKWLDEHMLPIFPLGEFKSRKEA